MTKRQALESVAKGIITEEIMVWAADEIDKMDTANKKRREKTSKKRAENEPIKVEILGVLGEEPQTSTVVGKEISISTQKASALLRQLVAEGRANVEDVRIKGKGKQKGYTKA